MRLIGNMGKIKKIALIATFAMALLVAGGVTAWAQKQKTSKYSTSEKCKSCHDSPKKGDQYNKWKNGGHGKAFQTLATPKAKEIGKKNGIPDPQKSPKCLKCHVTAYDQPPAKKIADFKADAGVQCDSCHGPGDYHVETQTNILVDADFAGDDGPFGKEGDQPYKALPEGEIVVEPKEDVCKPCHNKESPTFKPDYYSKERLLKTEHKDPRKKRK